MNVTPLFPALFTKVRAFILTIVPAGTEVVQGIVNRVPQPTVNHVCITALFQRRLRTNVNTYEDDGYGSTPGVRNVEQGTEVHFQIDCYGSLAYEWADMISTMWRDEYGVTQLAPTLAPLYIDDARLMPLVAGEEQYIRRATMTAVAQFNPVTSLPQQFADEAVAGLVDAETLPVT